MQLNNLHFPGKEGAIDLQIRNGKIHSIHPSSPKGELIAEMGPPIRDKRSSDNQASAQSQQLPIDSPAVSLSFNNALIFPGLINSHDHLDFNLFPSLGSRIYNNYTEWGLDIRTRNKDEIAAILKIPQPLRTRWGLYKNLLNGFTTVINHGEKLQTDENLITVFQDYHCLHSVGFEKRWKWKLNSPWKTRHPFVLHVGEGTDTAAGQEIDRLIRWNLFKRPLIGVHGVAMNEEQASSFRALV